MAISWFEAQDKNNDGTVELVIAHYDNGEVKSMLPSLFTKEQLDDMLKKQGGGGQDKPAVPNEMPPPPKMPADKNSLLGDISAPKYGENGNDGNVTVNTDALRQFSAFLDKLAEPLNTVKLQVDKVSVHPGAFFQAFHLKNAVHTDPALQTNTSKAITQTLDAFALIKRGITKLVAEYESTEELNSASADDLNKILGDAKNVINKMSGNS